MMEKLPARIPDDNENAPMSEYLRIVWRRRWSFLAPFFALGLLGYAVAQILPLQYKSSSLIIVEQRTIPKEYVVPNVLMTLQKRLDAMTQQILSRTRLQRFIEDFGLYTSERKSNSLDDVIDTMRKRISVQLVQPGSSSTSTSTSTSQTAKTANSDLTGVEVDFSDSNPRIAQRVTNELTSLFIEQDARERTTQSQETTAFFQSQLEEGRKQLAAEEEKMRQYKLAHLGELPAEQQIHLSLLAGLGTQLQASTSALDRAEQQRIDLESKRAQLQMFSSLVTPPSTDASSALANGTAAPGEAGNPGTSLEAMRATLANLQQQLREASTKFTDKHPEIERLKKEIATTETTVDRLAKERTADLEIDSRLKAVLAEIESERRQNADLRRRIGEVQAQLSQTPIREQEMAELARSYENAKENVKSLLEKKQGSELASNLEEQQGGERFRLLDPATLPKRPEGRLKIVLAGWFLAFVVGAGLVLLRENLDKSIHKTADLESYRHLPVLVRIPEFRSPLDEVRGRRRRWLELAAGTVMVLIALASGADTLLRG
jgi:uncharacterized protein involved in exopolysaccharide biosynthesis